MPDELYVQLDSGPAKDSLSVAEARHVVRVRMLMEALDALHEIGMNPENRPNDRTSALKIVVDFAAEADGNDTRVLEKLRPEVARRLAKLGKARDDAKSGIAQRTQSEGNLLPDGTEK